MRARPVVAAHVPGMSFALRPSVDAVRGANREEPFDVACPRCTALDPRQLPSHPARHRAHLTRSISRTAIEAAIEFGPCVEIRDAQIFTIGRKAVEEYRRDGIDLSDFEGTQVVTASGTVMTVYRNRDFSSLRVRRRRSFRR